MMKIVNQCYIYIGLWILYNLQGTLYASGSILSRGLLAIVLTMSLYYFFYVNYQYKISSFFKVLNILLLVFTLYGGYNMLFGGQIRLTVGDIVSIPNYYYLKDIYMSLLSVYGFFHFVKKGWLNEKKIRILSLLFVIVATANYLRSQQEAMTLALEEGSLQEGFTNNASYEFLYLLPILFFWRKRVIVLNILLCYMFYFIIMGMKRGAIIIGACVFIYMIYRIYMDSKGWTRCVIFLLTCFVLCVGFYFVQDIYFSSDYFQYRIEQTLEGESSNRDYIYTKFLDHFLHETSGLQFFFGGGANATVRIAGAYAHNDWLELAINQGVLGIVLYLSYFISLFRVTRRNRLVWPQWMISLFYIMILIIFTKSLFSMSYASLSISFSICLGYCLAFDNYNKYEKSDFMLHR